MKLSFRKSGGFAAMFQGCKFDTDANPADAEALLVETMVKESDIMTETSKRVAAARDVFFYTFDIELNGQTHKVTFDQLSVPPKVKPLLEFLLARVKNMMPD
jgi:hypothetical protein